jgi:hypothetical protein
LGDTIKTRCWGPCVLTRRVASYKPLPFKLPVFGPDRAKIFSNNTAIRLRLQLPTCKSEARRY